MRPLPLVLVLVLAGCASNGGPESEPEAPKPGEPGAEPVKNLLTEPERRRLYIDLDKATEGYITSMAEGRIRAAESVRDGFLTPRVDGNITELIETAGDPEDPFHRNIAARALGFATDSSRAVPALVALLDAPDPGLVTSALASLYVLKDPETPLAPLLDLLGHPDVDVRVNDVLVIYAVIRGRAKAGPLERTPEIREIAGQLLLVVATRTEDDFVRANAAAALGAIGDPAATDVLVNLLGEESSRVRTRAAEGLGQLGRESAIPPLIDALEVSTSPVESRTIAAALGAIGRDAGFPVSEAALGLDPESWRSWYTEVKKE